jgi:hypothetical protein
VGSRRARWNHGGIHHSQFVRGATPIRHSGRGQVPAGAPADTVLKSATFRLADPLNPRVPVHLQDELRDLGKFPEIVRAALWAVDDVILHGEYDLEKPGLSDRECSL